MIVSVKNLSKNFKTKQKSQGLIGSFYSLFRPKYNNVKAVDDLSFEINKGECVAFIGPNGAGKSTTLKMLTGILYPSSGEISVLGFNPSKDRKKLSYHIGTVFGQRSQLWYHLPALDTFELFSRIYDLKKEDFEERLNHLVSIFEIKEFLYTPVRKLSLGQRMRAELVLALLHKPKVIFLDEPTIGLDIISKKSLREHIKKINSEEETTVVLTSHDMDDIEQVCKRVIIINHGKIIYDDSIVNLKKKYLKKKVFEIIFDDKISKLIKKRGIQILEKDDYKLKIEVDLTKNSVPFYIQEIMSFYKNNNFSDLNIFDRDIEDIIEEIYNQENGVK